MYFITKNGPFWPSRINPSKSQEHFYGRFYKPVALLFHHWTLLSSAVQVRSLYCISRVYKSMTYPIVVCSLGWSSVLLFPTLLQPFCSGFCVDKIDEVEPAEAAAVVAAVAGVDEVGCVVQGVVGEGGAPALLRLSAEVEAAEVRFSWPASEVGSGTAGTKRPLLRERSRIDEEDEANVKKQNNTVILQDWTQKE